MDKLIVCSNICFVLESRKIIIDSELRRAVKSPLNFLNKKKILKLQKEIEELIEQYSYYKNIQLENETEIYDRLLAVGIKRKYVKELMYSELIKLLKLTDGFDIKNEVIFDTEKYTIRYLTHPAQIVRMGFKYNNCLKGRFSTVYNPTVYYTEKVIEVVNKINKKSSFVFSLDNYIDIRGYQNALVPFELLEEFLHYIEDNQVLSDTINSMNDVDFQVLINKTI
jgi:hypothetical protein